MKLLSGDARKAVTDERVQAVQRRVGHRCFVLHPLRRAATARRIGVRDTPDAVVRTGGAWRDAESAHGARHVRCNSAGACER
jgi:hypothetical protein